MNRIQSLKIIITLSALVILGACSSDTEENSIKFVSSGVNCMDCAVITSVAADFGSSGVDFIETTSPFGGDLNFVEQDLSDVRATTFGDHFYRLGRFNQDNVSKWSYEQTVTPVWEFSLESGANPYDMIFVSETKAYILRWGADEIWIVDPSVDNTATVADFKIGEIDLSAYNQGAGSNAAAAVLDNGYLYVVLEGLDSFFDPATSHLVKIDTMTDTEVDVNGTDPGKGFVLTVKNAGDLELLGTDVFVAGKGQYESFDGITPAVLSGGIEKVNIAGATFTSALLVDDDDVNVGAQITDVEIASATRGYLLRYNGRGNIDLIGFNADTGVVDAAPLDSEYAGENLSALNLDANNQLWIGIGEASNPRVEILSTIDELLLGTAMLEKNPSFIKFPN